jgi:hypothetical protein
MSFESDPDGFRPCHIAHTDDYLFVADRDTRVRAYRFAVDGGVPAERVCELKGLKSPYGMAFHRATGTLLIACHGAGGRGVELLDTRPPPAQWHFHPSDRSAAVEKEGVSLPPVSIAIDEPNGFVYVATYNPQTITQYKATVKTADEKDSAEAVGKSTVDLKLTAVRELEGAESRAGQLSAVAVLSPSTLLLSHSDRTVEVLTHTAASGEADSKLAGPVGQLRALEQPRKSHESARYATGIAVDAERRRIFAGEALAARVAVYDADSGRPIAEVQRERRGWGSAAGVALIDGVLVTSDYESKCLHFLAIDAIPGLK